MNNNEIKLESGMAKLYELQTNLKRSIDNINKLGPQYTVLCEIVESSERKSELPENFIEGIKETKAQNEKQLPLLNERLAYINMLIDMYEKQDEKGKLVDKIVSLTMASLGLSQQVYEEEPSETN